MFTVRQVILQCQKNTLLFRTDIMPFYAVRRGRIPGVYGSWDECKQQVDKFVKARYKKFSTQQEAIAFVKGCDNPATNQVNHHTNSHSVQSASTSSPNPQTFKTSSAKNFSNGYQKARQQTSNSHTMSEAVRLKIAEKEVEYLKEKLKMKEAEHRLLQTKAEINQLKSQENHSKSSPVKHTSHKSKPYQRYQKTANSSNWKQNRTTQLIDLDEARQIHTAASSYNSGSSGSSPVVYTDGACVNNGQDGARAGIGVYWGPDHPLNTSERLPGRQTNNRAEIHAVVKAVDQARQSGFDELTVKTDSMFLINSMTKWLPGWQKKGWKTSTGNPVINREDFEALLEVMDGIKINWVHVRGHQGHAGNENADRLAVQGANMP